ncbi:hypothetical protein AURDEDRAFT_177626 [Auricularia subglabra TFB-10046 SS5]|uniref:Uncharacterized protein n=1 Tax=Auricularia subglabra (strain TFB-10046 / SS5) TaxID=717982 RepID=J0WLT6_AURST|nr:hypothetical protein AURDEDRAFT_177626 [Auricularia subglabra TFB-10046 SS5]
MPASRSVGTHLTERKARDLGAYYKRISRQKSLTMLRMRECAKEHRILYSTLKDLDDGIMSEDETDDELSTPGNKVFRRIEKGWVDPALTLIFHETQNVEPGSVTV